jgi:transcriptional regulator with XRE-family HTH domain
MRARKRRGWSQTRLAAELGRSDRWVRLLEAGELPWVRRIEDGRTPAPHDLRVLTQLVDVLDLELAELMRAPDVVALAAVIMGPPTAAPKLSDVPTSPPPRGRPPLHPAGLSVHRHAQ